MTPPPHALPVHKALVNTAIPHPREKIRLDTNTILKQCDCHIESPEVSLSAQPVVLHLTSMLRPYKTMWLISDLFRQYQFVNRKSLFRVE